VDHRPLWMTLASATVLEEIAEARPRAGGPRRQRRQDSPKAGVPANTAPPADAPVGIAAAPAVPLVDHQQAPEPVDEPAEQSTTADASELVLRRFDAYSCEGCGSRYTRDDDEHPCGPLTPVTVTVAGLAAPAPQQQVLGRYDAFACPACDGRWGHDVPQHGCGPLTPVTVTITARAAGGPA
jgi:hypothetical protein